MRKTFSNGVRRQEGRNTSQLRDAFARGSGGPSLSHTLPRRADSPEIPRSIRGAVSAPRDFVFPSPPPIPATSSHTPPRTAPSQCPPQPLPPRPPPPPAPL